MSTYPSGARVRNDGQHEQFLAQNHHVAIIDKELCDAVQAARLVRTNVTVLILLHQIIRRLSMESMLDRVKNH